MDKIDRFFEKQLLTVYSTKKIYRINIQTYFKRINKNIDTYLQNNTYEQIEEDIRRLYLKFVTEKKPPLSIRTFFNSVKQYLISNDKKIRDLEIWDTLKYSLKGSEAAGDDFVPNQKDIKAVLSHGNTLSRAMFTMLASSGRRIEEIISLYPEDIDTTHIPTRINVKKGYDPSNPDKIKLHTKSGSKTICFISDEATEAYISWMKERDRYLKSAVQKMNLKKGKKKDPNDKRVFPMSYDNARYIWKILVKRSGLYKKDSRTKRLTLHPHCLRKFYRSYLGDADLSEHLMGHASSGLVKIYRNMKIEDLAEKYKNLMYNVTFFELSPDLTGVHEELKEKDRQISTMQQEIHNLRNQIGDFQKLVEDPQNARKLLKSLLQMATDKEIKQNKKEG